MVVVPIYQDDNQTKHFSDTGIAKMARPTDCLTSQESCDHKVMVCVHSVCVAHPMW